MQEEVWLPVKGYESRYKVSNLGRVKSFKRVVRISPTRTCTYGGRLMVPCLDSTGRYATCLRKNNTSKSYTIHRIVAITFLNYNDNNKYDFVVDHIDENPHNNHLSNLQVITQRENTHKSVIKRGNRTSKYMGVSWAKERNRWCARVRINGFHKNMGYFKTEMEANNICVKIYKEISNGK